MKKWNSRSLWFSTALFFIAQVLVILGLVDQKYWLIASLAAIWGYLITNTIKRVRGPGFEIEMNPKKRNGKN